VSGRWKEFGCYHGQRLSGRWSESPEVTIRIAGRIASTIIGAGLSLTRTQRAVLNRQGAKVCPDEGWLVILPKAAPAFYDCEASGFDGVPIEIGWAFAESGTAIITSEGHLVRPPADWLIEESWDSAAEALHGISLGRLRRDGRPVWEIAQRMNRVLDGRELFSDSPLDGVWLRCIFEAAGIDPSFTIGKMDAEALISELAANRGFDAAAYTRAKTIAAHLAPLRHRAEADARYWAILWNVIEWRTLAP